MRRDMKHSCATSTRQVYRMIQTTLRFYKNSPDEMKVWGALQEHKKYGFDSTRKMIVAAVLNYIGRDTAEDVIDIDALADKIARKLKVEGVAIEEGKNELAIDDGSNYDDALNFIKNL